MSADTYTLHHGDCLEVMREMPDNSVDAICADPPYGLGMMGKKWDKATPSLTIWEEALRVLKPGGHALAFGGTRTHHRLMCSMEDAGFKLRDVIMWIYGCGFPKSHTISRAIDKEAGAEREVIGPNVWGRKNGHENFQGSTYGNTSSVMQTAHATDAAKQWDGWGTALKPAYEPIILVRKPITGTIAANVVAYGTGALNIDGCRVPLQGKEPLGGGATISKNGGWRRPWMDDPEAVASCQARRDIQAAKAELLGRWPANFIHDGSEEVVSAFPGPHQQRFFYCAKTSPKDRHAGIEGVSNGHDYRNHHPTVKPTDLMRYLVRLITPPGGVVLDMFMGSGSTGKACMLEGFRFIGIEQDEAYVEIARQRIEAANKIDPQLDLLKVGTE